MIYFITAREVGRVKIGYSAEPRQRFMGMRTGSPVELTLERVCEGDMFDEGVLHQEFHAHRVNLEWFTLSPEIEAYMAALPAPPKREQTFTAQLRAALGMNNGYASMIATGKREITIPVALAFYNATGRRIGPLAEAEPHEIEVLTKFIEPWTASKSRAA